MSKVLRPNFNKVNTSYKFIDEAMDKCVETTLEFLLDNLDDDKKVIIWDLWMNKSKDNILDIKKHSSNPNIILHQKEYKNITYNPVLNMIRVESIENTFNEVAEIEAAICEYSLDNEIPINTEGDLNISSVDPEGIKFNGYTIFKQDNEVGIIKEQMEPVFVPYSRNFNNSEFSNDL